MSTTTIRGRQGISRDLGGVCDVITVRSIQTQLIRKGSTTFPNHCNVTRRSSVFRRNLQRSMTWRLYLQRVSSWTLSAPHPYRTEPVKLCNYRLRDHWPSTMQPFSICRLACAFVNCDSGKPSRSLGNYGHTHALSISHATSAEDTPAVCKQNVERV